MLRLAYHASVLAMLARWLYLLLRNLRRLRSLEDERPPQQSDIPLISVLIPARNEIATLGRCLASLLLQTYPRFNITVLDDRSNDGTRDLAASYAIVDDRVSVIDGDPLPEGWTGKPWACHQLAERANGEILLFVDADTWFEPDALARTVGVMQRDKPGLFSVMPHQVTGTLAERTVVPGLYLLFLAGTPLWRVEDPSHPTVAAANGQFMCFWADAYRDLGGHAVVRDQVVEDLALARVAKQSGLKILPRTAVDTVHCRMYRSWREVLDGFAKNAYEAMGERPTQAIGYSAVVASTQIVPTALLFRALLRRTRTMAGFWLPLVEVGTLMAMRLLLSRRMRFHLTDALLSPFTALAFIVITARSIWWRYRGGYRWKGRRYLRGASPR